MKLVSGIFVDPSYSLRVCFQDVHFEIGKELSVLRHLIGVAQSQAMVYVFFVAFD